MLRLKGNASSGSPNCGRIVATRSCWLHRVSIRLASFMAPPNSSSGIWLRSLSACVMPFGYPTTEWSLMHMINVLSHLSLCLNCSMNFPNSSSVKAKEFAILSFSIRLYGTVHGSWLLSVRQVMCHGSFSCSAITSCSLFNTMSSPAPHWCVLRSCTLKSLSAIIRSYPVEYR